MKKWYNGLMALAILTLAVGCGKPEPSFEAVSLNGIIDDHKEEAKADERFVYELKLDKPMVVEDGEVYDGLVEGNLTRLSRSDADPIAIKNIRGELTRNQAGIVMELRPGATVRNVIIAENCQIDATLAKRLNIHLENVEWEGCAVNVITGDSPGYLSLINCSGLASITYDAPDLTTPEKPGMQGDQEVAKKEVKPVAFDDGYPNYLGSSEGKGREVASSPKPPKLVPGKPFHNWGARIAYYRATKVAH